MPSCVWVRVPSLARFLEIGECSPVFFFAPAGGVLEKRSGPHGFVSLCHCVTSPWGERKRLSPFRSLARFLEIEECFPRSHFFCAREQSSDKRSGPRGFVPLCHCVTSPEGERKRLPPFRSLARFLEIEECSSVSFKPSCGVITGKLSGRTPHSTDKLCVLLTLSGLKRFLTYKLLIVIVMSVNNRLIRTKLLILISPGTSIQSFRFVLSSS